MERPSFQIFLLLFAISSPNSFGDDNFSTSLDLQTQSSYTRLRLSLDDSFKPVVKETKVGFEVTIPSATLMDVGVPFGQEAEFKRYLSKVSDGRVAGIEITEKESGLTIKGKFKYPSGAQALANPSMEHFDFRQTEQGKYVLDFWYKKGLTVTELAAERKQGDAKNLQKQKDILMKRESDRKVSREKRMEDARNAIAFCEQPFDRSNTVFLKYRAEHPLVSFIAYYPEHIPDHGFEYIEPKNDSEEAQMVRLALKLSRENNHALVVKTVDFLQRQYPKSTYLQQMLFLKANSFYRLGLEDKGKDLIFTIAKEARGTEVGLQAQAFLAVQAFQRKEWLLALDSFSGILHSYPKHPLAWLFHYASAECLYEIRQADQAIEEYEWVAKNAPKEQIKAEAAFKIGDVYFDRSQYALAIQKYLSSIKKYESNLPQYPHPIMNLAESFFQLEEFQRANDTFEHFLKVGANHPEAWRASLRIAEIKALNQRLDGGAENAFVDTVNRYPMTPGAVIARLRMLPCGNHGGFDLGGMQRLVNSAEVQNFASEASVYSSSFKELVALTEVRSLISFGADEQAIEKGILHLRENPTVEVRNLIERAMIGGIKRLLVKQLDAGEIYPAIATYEKYGDYLPLPLNDPYADDLRMKLAKFAADKNFKTLALKIIEPYQKLNEVDQKEVLSSIEKNLALDSTKEQEDRTILEVKTIWNSEDFKIDDSKQSDVFLAKLTSISDLSPHRFERDLLEALFFQDKKDYKKAEQFAANLIPSFSKLNSLQKAQIWFLQGELAQNADDNAVAAKSYREARLLKTKASEKEQEQLNFRHLKLVPSIAYLYTSEGEALEHDQKWKEAVALYGEAVENKVGGNRLLYAHAKAILKEGGRNSNKIAMQSLQKIKQSQDDDVWKNLATKTLDDIAKEGEVNDKSRAPK